MYMSVQLYNMIWFFFINSYSNSDDMMFLLLIKTYVSVLYFCVFAVPY